MRRLLLAGLTILVSLSLAGCTVPTKGLTGLTVDRDGNLVVELAWCEGHPPDVVIMHIDRNDDTVAKYESARQLTGTHTSFLLESPGEDWKLTPAVPTLDPAKTYRIYGATRNNSASTMGVTFGTSDRNQLTPDQIMTNRPDPSDKKGQFWSRGVVDRADFARLAQSMC